MPRPAFPKHLREFQRRFATEVACQQYLAASRWPDGFCVWTLWGTGPLCARRSAAVAMCELPASGFADLGTVLHNTKLPLTEWFWAAYLMTTDTRGISALGLQRQLGLSPL